MTELEQKGNSRETSEKDPIVCPNRRMFLKGVAGMEFHDFSLAISEPGSYFDTDHLNRAGLTEFFACQLKTILVSPKGG